MTRDAGPPRCIISTSLWFSEKVFHLLTIKHRKRNMISILFLFNVKCVSTIIIKRDLNVDNQCHALKVLFVTFGGI